MSNKAKYWWAVLYNENMSDTWKDDIADLLQFPFAYCVHDKDTLSDSAEDRKVHTHIIIAFNNTTTYKHAFSIFETLNKNGCKAFNKIERCLNIRHCYDYLIHDTDECRKKNKYQYPVEERILGNNFDIGMYEQISTLDKILIQKDLSRLIEEHNFFNFMDFHDYVRDNLDNTYYEIFRSNQSFFNNLVKGYYNKNFNRKYTETVRALEAEQEKNRILTENINDTNDEMEF